MQMDTDAPYVLFSGQLRHRLDFCRLKLVPDGRGGNIVTPDAVLTTWGNCRPLNGKEEYIAKQQVMSLSIAIDMRYTKKITSDMWAIYTNPDNPAPINYKVRMILNVANRNRKLTLLCEQRPDLK